MKKIYLAGLLCLALFMTMVRPVGAASGTDHSSVRKTVEKKSRKDFIVAIDAGHQRKGNHKQEPLGPGSARKKARVSDGTQGVSTGLAEYKLNLAVAKRSFYKRVFKSIWCGKLIT